MNTNQRPNPSTTPKAPALEAMLTRKDIMEALAISLPTLRKAIRDGEFPKPAKIGGVDRWPASCIAQYIQQSLEANNATEEAASA